MVGEEGGEAALDAVDGGDEEVTGAHGDIGDAEVEEVVVGGAVAERRKAREVVIQRGFEGVIEQVFDGEAFGVVGAGGLAPAGGVVEVNLVGANDDVPLPFGGDVEATRG